jgi:8-oxo-dGTP pyrophosphatase MutT (NUDIX family)
VSEPWPAALSELVAALPRDLPAWCPASLARQVADCGLDVRTSDLADLSAGEVASALLVQDELSRDGDRAEELCSAAADAVRPNGMVLLTVLSASPGGDGGAPRGTPAARTSPRPRTEPRRFTSEQIEHLLLHRGLAVQRLERAGDRLLVLAKVPVSGQERSARFIASLPFKLVTAGVVCRDEAGRLLCVYDSFRRHWTVPGGVVDAEEDPRSAAVREAVEEAGVSVIAGDLLGVFQTAVPDRLLLLYAAQPEHPTAEVLERPRTRHPHEIGEVRWVAEAEALDLLNPRTRWQVEQCLRRPGETWRE